MVKSREYVCFAYQFKPCFIKIYYFLKFLFVYILNRFDALILKIIFLKIKKIFFNTFQYKKYFKKQQQPYSRIFIFMWFPGVFLLCFCKPMIAVMPINNINNTIRLFQCSDSDSSNTIFF